MSLICLKEDLLPKYVYLYVYLFNVCVCVSAWSCLAWVLSHFDLCFKLLTYNRVLWNQWCSLSLCLSLSSFASAIYLSFLFTLLSTFLFLIRTFLIFFLVFYSLLLVFLFTFFRCPFHPSSSFFIFLFLFLAICTRGCGVFLWMCACVSQYLLRSLSFSSCHCLRHCCYY